MIPGPSGVLGNAAYPLGGWPITDITAAINITVETDTAFPISSEKTVVIGLATETDTAFSLVTAIPPGKLCGTIAVYPALEGTIDAYLTLDGEVTVEPTLSGDITLRRCD